MDDDSSPISLYESIILSDAVLKSKTLKDMGIYPITKWQLTGRCSRPGHGLVTLTYETTDEDPKNQGYLKCLPCLYDQKVERWVPIIESRRV